MQLKLLLDLLFPIECVGCGKDGEWLCQQCLDRIKLLAEWHCPVCKTRLTNGRVCEKCSPQSFLDGAIVAVFYDDELINKAVHYLKYKGIKNLAKPLGRLLAITLNRISFWDNNWILVPVPLHKRRERFRGFNQAELIASEVAKCLNLEVGLLRSKKASDTILVAGCLIDSHSLKPNLYRIKNTHSQIKLKREDRLRNMVGAFGIKNPAFFTGKKIILIDDVMTTGATLQECAKELKLAGAASVWAAVIARGI